ncbi:hypothetical protein OS493_021245 [Desmophyllum pertusum]|uniref:Uncharacterized protein n=1 Tax=Desmophyllum pertusum TaxID=174260 RepID=A0A9X0D3R3_9CNID|nr:hypothetical protein OS493_021245 [Desmophyllum pertusum]
MATLSPLDVLPRDQFHLERYPLNISTSVECFLCVYTAAVRTCQGCFVAFVMTAFSWINKGQTVQVSQVNTSD